MGLKQGHFVDGEGELAGRQWRRGWVISTAPPRLSIARRRFSQDGKYKSIGKTHLAESSPIQDIRLNRNDTKFVLNHPS